MNDREEYVTALALAFGLEAMKLMPAGSWKEADRDDMQRLLARIVPTDRSRKNLLGSVRMSLAEIPAGQA